MPSFMAKWSEQYPGCSGHVHQSLSDGKTNLFYDAKSSRKMSPLFESYLAGQVACLMEFAPMFWPTINSYKRLVDGFWAPVKPTWGIDNRTASFRVIAGSPKATRLETRCPGADVNPYLAKAACIAAGLYGVEKGLKLTAPPITGTNEGGENIPRAPRTLIETTRNFSNSTVARDFLGDTFVEHFAATRDWEWRQWLDGVTDWELKRYFEII
jgi:glutamine synthetase